MPVAHYNTCMTTGDLHPAFRSYNSDRIGAPHAGTPSDGGVHLPPPRPPAIPPHAHPNGTLETPSFSLPASGVPYTGPFPVPHSGHSSSPYHGSHGPMPMDTMSQNATSMSNGHGSTDSLGNLPPPGCPGGYPSAIGSYPTQNPQQFPSDHYQGAVGQSYPGPQYPSYGMMPSEENSGYHQPAASNLHDLAEIQCHLSTIYEDLPEGGDQFRSGDYLHQPNPMDLGQPQEQHHHHHHLPQQHHPTAQPFLKSPVGQEETHCASSSQVITPKVEPEWIPYGDVLNRFQQIRLRTDTFSPPRDTVTKPRRHRRSSEKRKEKSRDAARCRRGKESEIFTELANALPLPAQTIAQLDKASVMRLTIAFLKTRALCQAGLSKGYASGRSDAEGAALGKLDVEMDSLFLKALDGFLLVLSTDGDVVYTSENIASFLGLPQVDVMGQSLYDYTHPCDHTEVQELVSGKGSQGPRHSFLRLKCTITAKGRSVNLKSASYKVVQVSGELVRGEEDECWVVALGTPVPHPSNIEFPLDKQTFVSKHSLDMKFTYVDDNVGEFCNYKEDELVGRSLYEMHHALDSDLIKDAYKTLRSKGQVETGRYRFLARDGGYVWVVTQATLINGPKDHKPQYVVCLNYIVSGVESPGEVLSELQLRCSEKKNNNNDPCIKAVDTGVPLAPLPPAALHTVLPEEVPELKTEIKPKLVLNGGAASLAPPLRVALPPPTPVASTFKIFTPRTEEMNKGYLIFSDDDPCGIELKDEPDDLTHLAPSGGDTCVPLEVPTFLPELDDVFIPFSSVETPFSSPTSISENSLDQGKSPKSDKYEVTDRGKISHRFYGGKIIENRGGNHSPFSNCSSPSSCDGLRTPEPPKPLLSQASIYQSSGIKPLFKGITESSRPRTTTGSLFTQLDEVCGGGSTSPSISKLELKVEEESMDADEFDLRAPYIPLSNELLMLNQDDLMWGAHSEPIISPTGVPTNKRDTKYSNLVQEEEDSSLAQLLRDRDPPIAGSGKNIQFGNSNSLQRNQYQQQSKFLEGGGGFVDPNKVLPGHFGGKDGIDDGGGSGTVEEDPPQVVMHEEVEPPPPLVNGDAHQQSSLTTKRRHSPASSPLLAHKRLCSLLYDQELQQQNQEVLQHQVPQMQSLRSGVRELTTPYAPTMQQLLISKEPIQVRGGRPSGGIGGGGGISTPLSIHKAKDSVLRNLLNLCSDGEDSFNGEESKVLTAPVRITQEQMRAMLLAEGDSINAASQLPYPKLRILTGSQGSRVQGEHHSFKVTPTSVRGGGGVTNGGPSGEVFLKRGRRQDPFLLMDPDLTIPNLLDLSQLDYEVNAPANNSSLLQGADLLMALDQGL